MRFSWETRRVDSSVGNSCFPEERYFAGLRPCLQVTAGDLARKNSQTWNGCNLRAGEGAVRTAATRTHKSGLLVPPLAARRASFTSAHPLAVTSVLVDCLVHEHPAVPETVPRTPDSAWHSAA
jgi:hypothetical protein